MEIHVHPAALCVLGCAGRGTDRVSVVVHFCLLFWSDWGLGGKPEKDLATWSLSQSYALIPGLVIGHVSPW